MYYITHENLSDEIKIRNSRFISLSYSLDNPKQAKSILSEMNNRFSDANHICYAYRICNVDQLDLFYNPVEKYKFKEIKFKFEHRKKGSSKMSFKVILNIISLLFFKLRIKK